MLFPDGGSVVMPSPNAWLVDLQRSTFESQGTLVLGGEGQAEGRAVTLSNDEVYLGGVTFSPRLPRGWRIRHRLRPQWLEGGLRGPRGEGGRLERAGGAVVLLGGRERRRRGARPAGGPPGTALHRRQHHVAGPGPPGDTVLLLPESPVVGRRGRPVRHAGGSLWHGNRRGPGAGWRDEPGAGWWDEPGAGRGHARAGGVSAGLVLWRQWLQRWVPRARHARGPGAARGASEACDFRPLRTLPFSV
jgi:hypothetical protein